ncbi:MAG TPA: hypothetical protein VK831_01630 [Candidatus Deferrimicrobiaceae bacterium]|nr:hypothetical protein [Candidatus Deferrimicrobiaceae bacterium]
MSRPGGLVALAAVAVAAVLAACGTIQSSAPPHAPESFPEIVSQLGRFGVVAENWVAGDSGCSDATLGPTAIRFEASGLDQATAVPLRIYIFRNRETWDRRRADVDACIAEWAAEPATFEFVDPSPYVLTGPGPWPAEFEAAVRKALDEASGSGG